MGLKVREKIEIAYLFVIKITKMFNDDFFNKKGLGLWISYT
jgi:uncharacterized protein YebE (UPF0316 family)